MRLALVVLTVMAAATATAASVPDAVWFSDNFAAYDPGQWGFAVQDASPKWQAAPEGATRGQLRVVDAKIYQRASGWDADGRYVELKGDAHIGSDVHVQTTGDLSAKSAGKPAVFHFRSKRGATPFPGVTGWYHACMSLRDSANADIACWAAGSVGLKAHLTTAPIAYPKWNRKYYGILPHGWVGGPTPTDTSPGVEYRFVDDYWHDFDITYDPATGITKWLVDGNLIWTQTQATGRAVSKVWCRDVCVHQGEWAWEDRVFVDEMVLGSVGASTVSSTAAAPDTASPLAVTGLKTLRSKGQITVSWTNPPDMDVAGTMVRCKLGSYPTGPKDGTLVVDKPGSAGSKGSFVHSNTADNAYYYAAFAYDKAHNYSSAATAQAPETIASYLRLHPENPHYFQEANTGKPLMITAFSSIVPSALDHDYVAGINQLISMRIGYSRVWHFLPWSLNNAIWPWGRSTTPDAPMGGNKIDMDTWNPTYWTRMKDAMSRAMAGGIIPEIHLFDRCGLSPGGSQRYEGNPWAGDNNINNLEMPPASGVGTPEFYYYSTKPNLRNQQERYIRKMIDETIQYPNIIYEIENEHQGSNDPDWVTHYAQFVKDYLAANYPSSPRLVSYNSLEDDIMAVYSLPTVDIFNQHWGATAQNEPDVLNACIESNWYRNKAINVDEFANGVGDPAVLSNQCWIIVTSGGNFHIEDSDPVAAMTVVENIRSFKALTDWDFIHAAPNKHLVTSNNGYCLAQPGVEYVFYFPWGGTKTIDVAPGNYRAEWWHPLTGGFYQISTINHSGGTLNVTAPDGGAWALHLTTRPALATALNCRPAGSITIDGSPSDWALGELSGEVHGGDVGTGDVAVVGLDSAGVFCRGACAMGMQYPPTNAADHTVKVYSRHSASYIYFLARMEDSDIRHPNPVGSNWTNDCVEISIDPQHNGGGSALSGSTSDAQIVIDANNQKNVYSCSPAYTAQVLGGVTSAVTKDSTGWWLEARIAKSAFSPAIAGSGAIGVDFCVRDNDGGDYASSVYTWRDASHTAVPSKVPDRWGDLLLSTTTGDTTPPGEVSSFSATGGAGQITLNWTNPLDTDYTGVMIRCKTTGFPTSVSDGALLVDKGGSPGAAGSHIQTGVSLGVTYYYKAFAHDGVPNYSIGMTAIATPTATISVPTINIRRAGSITIDGSPSDWNVSELTSKVRAGELVAGDCAIVGYDNGGLYYAGRWTDGALPTQASDHTARIYARHDPDNLYLLVRCDDNDIRCSGSVGANWINDCIELYLDPSHDHGSFPINNSASDVQLVIDAANQRNIYTCTSGYTSQVLAGADSAVVRDATGWWLEARIAKNALSPPLPSEGVFGLDFSFRDNDSNNDPAVTTVYDWCGNTSGSSFPSKIPDQWGNAVLTDIASPGAVSGLTVIAGDGANHLAWTNPTDADFGGVRILCKQNAYPQNPNDGAVVFSGAGTSCRHTNLANGTTYYYSAYAFDEVPNYSSAAQTWGAPFHLGPVQAGSLANGTPLTLTSGVVSAVFSGFFYVQSTGTEGPAGIRVVRPGHGVSLGQQVSARGVLRTDLFTAERYIDADLVVVTDP